MIHSRHSILHTAQHMGKGTQKGEAEAYRWKKSRQTQRHTMSFLRQSHWGSVKSENQFTTIE